MVKQKEQSKFSRRQINSKPEYKEISKVKKRNFKAKKKSHGRYLYYMLELYMKISEDNTTYYHTMF